jgi:hypothetical protein
MNNELILDLQQLDIEMKRISLKMLKCGEEANKHAIELYNASEIVYQWIKELECDHNEHRGDRQDVSKNQRL